LKFFEKFLKIFENFLKTFEKRNPTLNHDKHHAELKSDHLRTRLRLQVSARKEGE